MFNQKIYLGKNLAEQLFFLLWTRPPKKRKNISLNGHFLPLPKLHSSHRNIEKVTRLSNVQKIIDNFSQKHFLKNINETNKQEQNIS